MARIQSEIRAHHGGWRYDEVCQAMLGHDDSLTPTKIYEEKSWIDEFFGYAIRSPGIFSDLLRSFQVFKFSDLAKHASEDWRSLVTDFVCSEEFCPDPFYVSNMPTKAKQQKFAWCSSSGKDAVAKHMRESCRKKPVLFSHSECICAVSWCFDFFFEFIWGVLAPGGFENLKTKFQTKPSQWEGVNFASTCKFQNQIKPSQLLSQFNALGPIFECKLHSNTTGVERPGESLGVGRKKKANPSTLSRTQSLKQTPVP